MLTEKDYCDYETSRELKELGFIAGLGEDDCGHCLYDDAWHDQVDRPLLYEAQKWLREERGIHIAPRIYLYHDINLDEQTSWECTIYVEWAAIYTIGKSLTYEDALLLGIKEAVKVLNDKKQRRDKLELENTEFDYGHDVSNEQKDYEKT